MPVQINSRSTVRVESVTLNNATNLSDAFLLGGGQVVGIRKTATPTGTAITFQTSKEEGGTYLTETDKDNSAVTVTCTASTAQKHTIEPSLTAGFAKWCKVALTTGSDVTIEVFILEGS